MPPASLHRAWPPGGGDLEWFDIPSLSRSESHGIRIQTRLEFKNELSTRLLTWLLEHGYIFANIADSAASGPDGYSN